jgi:hypothetical protein
MTTLAVSLSGIVCCLSTTCKLPLDCLVFRSSGGFLSQHGTRHTSCIRLDLLSRRVVVYSPQIYENFSLKSGEGLSIAFVVIWLAGDLFNLAGAWVAGLLPTMIILAGYVRLFPLLIRWHPK